MRRPLCLVLLSPPVTVAAVEDLAVEVPRVQTAALWCLHHVAHLLVSVFTKSLCLTSLYMKTLCQVILMRWCLPYLPYFLFHL